MSYYQNLTFDGVDITSIENLAVTNVINDAMPDINISQGKLVRTDGVKLFNKEYGSRKVVVEGIITGSSRDTYFTARKALIKAVQPLEKKLVLPLDTPLEYTATSTNTLFSDTGGGFAKFSIEFVCSDPYGIEIENRVLLNGATSTIAVKEFDFLELVQSMVETPVFIRLSVISVTGGSSGYIELKNEAGSSIRITRNWANDDVLTVDTKLQEVRVNGIAVDYTGELWKLQIDESNMTYVDNFTTRNVSLIVTYRNRVL